MPQEDFDRSIAALDRSAVRAGLGDALDLAKQLHGLCAQAGDAAEHPARDEAASMLEGIDVERISELLRVLTVRFHLLNKTEQLEIASVNRARERDAGVPGASPNRESIAAAVDALADEGLTASEIVSLASRLDIGPTFTAHPTEARRRSVMSKQHAIAAALTRARDPEATPAEIERALERLDEQVQLMLLTDDVRAKRLDVPDEVRNGIHYLTGSVWNTLPRLTRDFGRALDRRFGEGAGDAVRDGAAPLARYRTWIGGDRDGNPKVTSGVTRETLGLMRRTAVELYARDLVELRHELSISTRRIDPPAALVERVEAEGTAYIDDPDFIQHAMYEPFRVRVMQIRGRLLACADYGSPDLIRDLEELRSWLRECGLLDTADRGPLADMLVRARAFGLRLATLDVRQHSRVHEQTVAEMLRAGGVTSDYASLDEAARAEVLRQEIDQPRPLLPPRAELSDAAHEALEVLRVIREAIQVEPGCVRAYVISMTHEVSHLLELMLMMKEIGLARTARDGSWVADLDIVPLFETVDDLQRAPSLLEELFADPVYRRHIASRGVREAAPGSGDAPPFQEVMLGYSDSNKDGGFLMANASLQAAQAAVARVCRGAGVAFRYFHGRGGTVGRGGGRAGRAIMATPPVAMNGHIRFTEQGEVISFRYALPDIARRHLEQIIHAALLATRRGDTHSGDAPAAEAMLADLPGVAMKTYRELIDDEQFWLWYSEITPVQHIGGLPIASRPVARGGGRLEFEKLRAIPWGFAWMQTRYIAPGWYGLGAAFDAATPEQIETLHSGYESSPFLRAVLGNAEQEMARARLPIAARYSSWHPSHEAMHSRIAHEYERARAGLLAVMGRSSLIEHVPVIKRAISVRNPWTDVLNLAQIELMRRARGGEADLGAAMFASINAIAAAMQSTG